MFSVMFPYPIKAIISMYSVSIFDIKMSGVRITGSSATGNVMGRQHSGVCALWVLTQLKKLPGPMSHLFLGAGPIY